jgi:hypothetical protein
MYTTLSMIKSCDATKLANLSAGCWLAGDLAYLVFTCLEATIQVRQKSGRKDQNTPFVLSIYNTATHKIDSQVEH